MLFLNSLQTPFPRNVDFNFIKPLSIKKPNPGTQLQPRPINYKTRRPKSHFLCRVSCSRFPYFCGNPLQYCRKRGRETATSTTERKINCNYCDPSSMPQIEIATSTAELRLGFSHPRRESQRAHSEGENSKNDIECTSTHRKRGSCSASGSECTPGDSPESSPARYLRGLLCPNQRLPAESPPSGTSERSSAAQRARLSPERPASPTAWPPCQSRF